VSHEEASSAELQPQYLGETLAFMFEARFVLRPTRYAMECPQLQHAYDACWSGFRKGFRTE
jgi:homogentisate 1,2-dioxygenase